MNGQTLFQIIIAILILNFIKDEWLDFLNAKRFNNDIPNELKDVYDEEVYKKSQAYKKTNYRFGILAGGFSFLITILFFLLDGVAYVDDIASCFTDHKILESLLFFGILGLASTFLQIPFGYYKTFVIEEKFGFNKTSKKTFFIDKLKGLFMTVVVGGVLLFVIAWLYFKIQDHFWWTAWLVFTVFTVFMNMFYSTLIVPLFNKQTPLEEGALKDKIFSYAEKVGFNLAKIFVIDGSKRSTKANAYFSGFGTKKRIVLYDTLINDLSEEEIVAVFAHEVGHFKKKHIIYNLILSILLMGVTLFILGVLIHNPLLSEAFHISETKFHVGLITFGILYSPISELTGLLMNILSRKFEYQADDYAKETFESQYLISSLKKLSKNSLSNLTPHPWYVFLHYSHPTLWQRVMNLKKG